MKAKQLIVLTLLAIILVSTMACGRGGGQATPTPTAGYLTYTDEANGFSISYPEDWTTMPPESLEAALIEFQDPEC